MSEPDASNAAKLATQARKLLQAAILDIAQAQFDKLPRPEECIVLFSGGVDSSVSLHLAASLLGVKHAITVLVQDTPASDAPWAEATTENFPGVTHIVLRPTLDELLGQDMSFLVQTIHSFDGMALRNSVCATHALRHAASLGFKYVLTGDAADELMGGYRFTHRHNDDDWAQQRATMVAKWHFDSGVVGDSLGLRVTSPFLHPPFVAFCLENLMKPDCIGPYPLRVTPSDPLEDGVITGKLPLRGAFPELLSSSRRKDPQEIGCGTTMLGAAPWATPPRLGFFDTRIEDAVLASEKARIAEEYAIKIRDKEHLVYFHVFEKLFGSTEEMEGKEKEGAARKILHVPGKPRPNDDPCPACGFKLDTPTQTFCLTCGHYDDALRFRKQGEKKAAVAAEAEEVKAEEETK
jgi:asparagine synthase (glutamine-hydrolysing)